MQHPDNKSGVRMLAASKLACAFADKSKISQRQQQRGCFKTGPWSGLSALILVLLHSWGRAPGNNRNRK
jgi:hypothetical protein